MTREEALKYFDSFGKTFTLDEARVDIHNLINKIYEDFESRKCKNCKYLSDKDICENEKSLLFKLDVMNNKEIAYFSGIDKNEFDNFGCNKFMRG